MGSIDRSFAQEQQDDLVADALAPRGVPERVNYATGVLLDATDFADEQRYVRGRLARVLAAIDGHGTLAGLRVSCPLTLNAGAENAKPNTELEVHVEPGLALDRLGRLIEVRFIQCLRIKRWLADLDARPPTDAARLALIAAVRDTPAILALDVFARFVICPHGKTPAFAAGPFNATDYVVPSRLADAFELTLSIANAVRVNPNDPNDTSTELAIPAPRSARLEALRAKIGTLTDPDEIAAARRTWALESVLDAWPTPDPTDPTRLPKLREHARESDWDRVLLARITLPVTQASAGAFPTLDDTRLADPAGDKDLADNRLRPIVFNPDAWRGAT
ncbi:MAG TPA: hypothetical protein VFS42_03980 [Burkholderiaceae bacterium]|nr:hypothetical protein [Burkholderiaceae bacterium]